MAGVLGLLLAGLLDLGMVAVFGLILVAGLDLALDCDGDLRLIVPALDLVFALLLVFAAALAFGPDFVFFLATMRAPLPLRTTASHVATNPKLNQGRWTAGTGDRNTPATTASYTERPRDATAPASVRVVGQARPPAAQGLRTGHRTGSN